MEVASKQGGQRPKRRDMTEVPCMALWVTNTCFCFRRQQRQQGVGGGGGGRIQNPLQHLQQLPQQHHNQQQQQQPSSQLQHQPQQPIAGQSGGNGCRPPREQHGRQYQSYGGQRPVPSHHGYSLNRRWHNNQKPHTGPSPGQGQPPIAGDKGTPFKNTKEKKTENVLFEESKPDPASKKALSEDPRSCTKPDQTVNHNESGSPNQGTMGSVSTREGQADGPRVNLLQSSKDRLRKRLKYKVKVLTVT